jgi:hypothetical protein
MPESKKLVWDEAGKHYYENGVSHGVLFVSNAEGGYEKGVAWSGLSKITESPEGAEETAIYANDHKYLSLRSVEEFKGTIEAYTYPDEWEACDGSAELTPGVFVTAQERKTFALAYQTNIGSDVSSDVGYKLHIVYGATASPSSRDRNTINDSPEANPFSWSFSTVKVEVGDNFKPTAHLVIDSRKCPAAALTKIKDALFGTDDTYSRLLLPSDVIDLINEAAGE